MEKAEISEGLAIKAPAGSSAITQNDAGTRKKSGTELTQRRSPDVLRDLLVKRNRVGAESRGGRLLSNLIKQRPWLHDTTGDRSWAKHPTQKMPWMMSVQVEALAKGK